MSIFKSSNPALGAKIFQGLSLTDNGLVMTRKGTLQKFGFMLLMLITGAYVSWQEFGQPEQGLLTAFLYTGLIGGLITSIVIIFKKEWSPYLAPAYGIFEGLFLGAISVLYNAAFATKAPGIVINAVGLTIGAAVGMYLLYQTGVIKATQRFKAVVMTATAGIAIFYLIAMVARMFGADVAFLHEGSLLGIGISVFIVAIAALNLILDFDMIDAGAEAGAPKYMEWYCAFGLMVTIVWLYLEILRLLSKLSDRK